MALDGRRLGPVLLALGLMCAAGAVLAADPVDPDWPCIQRKVPVISAGMMWAGPAVAENDRSWRDREELAVLVHDLSSRRLPIEDAYERIDSFAESLETDRNRTLTLLFTGVLQQINAERSEIMAGIERYTRRQRELADKVRDMTDRLNALRAKETLSAAEQEEAAQLEEQLVWDTRVFEEREQSLRYVCESPVLLEQRLFALARRLMGQLEE